MSFKRDGENVDLFGIAMRQRVSELLSEDIPEEDAYLMKNGKLSCVVCPHRPVFDTVNMLAIHRKGKRHLASEEHRQREREEVMVLAMKRNQLEYLQQHAGKAKTQLGGQWKKPKPYQRKTRVDLGSGSGATAACVETTPSSSLPGLPPRLPPTTSRQDSTSGQACKTGQQQQQEEAGSQHWPFAPHMDVHSPPQTSSPAELQTAPPPPRAAAAARPPPGPQLRQQYLQARGAGWKKDLLGNWVKDEDAEFDSDEEPPDLP